MTCPRALVIGAVILRLGVQTAGAQDTASLELVLEAGAPLRVALAGRVTVSRVGQPVSGTIVDAVYAYDRIVIPRGTEVTGHIVRLDPPSSKVRTRLMLSGDLTPARSVTLSFDTINVGGRPIPIQTLVTGGTPDVQRLEAARPEPEGKGGAVGRAREEAARQKDAATKEAHEIMAAIRRPSRWSRLRAELLARLPVHRQVIGAGTVYDAALVEPVSFGRVIPTERAGGVAPAPESVLHARILTAAGSATSARGAPMVAVVTTPIFTSDHRLVLPAGARLTGTVTFAKPARHFRRNGQLRFLFETVEEANRPASRMLAALHAVEAGAGEHLTLDEEGGATIKNSPTRFIAPAIAVFVVQTAADPQGAEDAVNGVMPTDAGHIASQGIAGAIGFGLVGGALGLMSKPVGVGLGLIGAAGSVYRAVFGKGHDVLFQAHTPIEVQLAPAPAPASRDR